MDILQKQCSYCKVLKSLDQFHNLKTGKLGKHSHCKKCRENYRKKLSYSKPQNGMLKCNMCHEIKDVDEYYRDKSSCTGLQSYCKNCQKEKIYESQSKLEGYISKLYNTLLTKYTDKVKITKEDILKVYYNQNKKCAFTDELLTYYSGSPLTENKYESNFNISISRKNINQDFTINNIELIGNTIYKMKGKLNNQEFLRLCQLISKKVNISK